MNESFMHTRTKPRAEEASLDSVVLRDREEYTAYFRHLKTVFGLLTQCYQPLAPPRYETESIRAYLDKLLFSVEALRKKYTYNPAHNLRVDLTESGFPNYVEISYLGVDLLSRKDRLVQLPPTAMLKQSVLDYMFRYHEEPAELLWQLSERDYFNMLEEERLFLPFTPGKVELLTENLGSRTYLFSWGCYDFKTNRPYIHILTFDQDLDADPLHWGGPNYFQFLEVIKAEGSRVPDVGVMALAIDNYLESIHPKILKRICIGPLHSPLTCVGEDDLCGLLKHYRAGTDDFILLLKDEIVFSVRQKELEGGVLGEKRVREIFYIPETDMDCYEARASTVHRYMLLPHAVLQQMDGSGNPAEFAKYSKLTFDRDGKVHGVQ